jgi:uncharacterized protein (DUF433 family)
METDEVGQHLILRGRNGRRGLAFKGTRYSVEGVLKRLARGESVAQVVRDSRGLTPEAVSEAVELASAALIEEAGARSPEHPERPPLSEPKKVGRHLIVHPNVCFGKLTFDGTRVPVATVLTFLGTGYTMRRIQEGWPGVKPDAVREAVRLAGRALKERYTPSEAGDEPARAGRAG